MALVTKDYTKLSIAPFLKRPQLLQRMMTDISKKGFIADALLRGGYNADGGIVPYTRLESIYATDNPVAIEELAEYPITNLTGLTPLEARATKYGFKALISEETVRRSTLAELARTMTKLSNSLIRFIDGQVLTAISTDAAVQTMAAGGAWSSSYTGLTLDIENAKAMIYTQFEGLEGDTLVIPSSKLAALTANTNIAGQTVGTKAPDNPIFTGMLPRDLWGLNIMHTPNLPASNVAYLLDRQDIGGIADEIPMSVRALPFDEEIDGYWIKARRVSAWFIQEPKGIVKITGI